MFIFIVSHYVSEVCGFRYFMIFNRCWWVFIIDKTSTLFILGVQFIRNILLYSHSLNAFYLFECPCSSVAAVHKQEQYIIFYKSWSGKFDFSLDLLRLVVNYTQKLEQHKAVRLFCFSKTSLSCGQKWVLVDPQCAVSPHKSTL